MAPITELNQQQTSLREALVILLKPIKETEHIFVIKFSWNAFPLKIVYWIQDSDRIGIYGLMDGWQRNKGLYITWPRTILEPGWLRCILDIERVLFDFHSYGGYSHIYYDARTMPYRKWSSEIARCPSTNRNGAEKVHPPFLRGPVDIWVHNSVPGQHPSAKGRRPFDALWFRAVPVICFTENWLDKSCKARSLAYRYSDGFAITLTGPLSWFL